MIKKYELTDETVIVDGKTLHRIRALISYADVKAGGLGGYVESEDNLSHEGRCWIYHGAMVYGKARVCESAKVYDSAIIYGNAIVSGYAKVYGNAIISDDVRVCDKAEVYDDAIVRDSVWVYDNAKAYGRSRIRDSAKVHGDASVHGDAMVCDCADVHGWAHIYGNALIGGTATVSGRRVSVCYDGKVVADAKVYGDAFIESGRCVCSISGLGSRHESVTFYTERTPGKINVTCGCFHGTLDEFEDAINNTYGDNLFGKEYLAAIAMAKLHFGIC